MLLSYSNLLMAPFIKMKLLQGPLLPEALHIPQFDCQHLFGQLVQKVLQNMIYISLKLNSFHPSLQ